MTITGGGSENEAEAKGRRLFSIKAFWNLSIRRKVTFITMGPTVGTLLLACGVLVIYDLTSFREHISRELHLLGEVIADNSKSALVFDDEAAAVDTLSALRVQSAIITSCIYAASGDLFAEYHRNVEEKGTCLSDPPAIGYHLEIDTVISVNPIILDSEVIGKVYIESDLQEQYRRLETFGLVALLILTASAAIVFIITNWFISKAAVKPINELRNVARQFGQGNLEARADVFSADEIGELATVFNNMADRLHTTMDSLSERNEEFEIQNLALNKAFDALELVSLTDPLTGANNRRFLARFMPQELARVHRGYHDSDGGEQKDIGFIMMDADHFKHVNDTYGHDAGDMVLKQIVQILKVACREIDWVVRWGGEEFLIVCRFTTRPDVEVVAERIRSGIAEHEFDINQEQTIRLTCSLGVTHYPLSTSQPASLSWEKTMNLADLALYRAKQSGRNAWIYLQSKGDEDPELLYDLAVADLAECIANGSIIYSTSQTCKKVTWQ